MEQSLFLSYRIVYTDTQTTRWTHRQTNRHEILWLRLISHNSNYMYVLSACWGDYEVIRNSQLQGNNTVYNATSLTSCANACTNKSSECMSFSWSKQDKACYLLSPQGEISRSTAKELDYYIRNNNCTDQGMYICYSTIV